MTEQTDNETKLSIEPLRLKKDKTESTRIAALEKRLSKVEEALRCLAASPKVVMEDCGIAILDVDGDPVFDFDKRLDDYLSYWESDHLGLGRVRADMRLHFSVRDWFLESKILEWSARTGRRFELES